MVVLHLTSLDTGGAGQYTMNIHRQMLADGYTSYVAVYGKKLIFPDGLCKPIQTTKYIVWNRIRRYVFRKYVKWFGHINPNYSGFNLDERLTCYLPKDLLAIMPVRPDIIMVHWVSNFANAWYVSELQRLTEAIVYYWMIDEAILSGACHYPWDCEQYQTGCKECPMTSSQLVKRAIRRNFEFKQKYLVKDKRVVLPTEFDRIRLDKSLLWRGCEWHKMIEIIDEDIFHPIDDTQVLRTKFNVPDNKRVVLFGCSNLNDPRKGMVVLTDSLKKIQRDDCVFMVVGNFNLPNLQHEVIKLGYVDIPTLAEAYQVADVFVCPSLEDSGPQMVNQAIMSGTPVVSFEIGVSLDIVHTGKTGYRAKFNDANDMAKGINYILDLPKNTYDIMCNDCRKLALDTYSKSTQSKFINELLETRL